MKTKLFIAPALIFTIAFTGCSDPNSADVGISETSSVILETASADEENESSNSVKSDASVSSAELQVRFGSMGESFTLHLYGNDTAAAIARHVGTASWQLPIYHYDDYDNWEVMQYYDIPSRYEIPSDPEQITEEKAGEVYYSEPNRIILFYGDGEVSAEYTRVGYFDCTEEFVSAVENNPVLEGWGNKLVLIDRAD